MSDSSAPPPVARSCCPISGRRRTPCADGSVRRSVCRSAAVHPSRLRSRSSPSCMRICVDYLVWDLARFEERDQRLAEVWHARLPSGHSARRAVDEALSRPGRSREALARLEAALAEPVAASPPRGAQKSWQEFVQFFNTVWSARRDAIEALLARHAHIGDWRLVGGIDADSILEERRRYQRVSATLPPGAS